SERTWFCLDVVLMLVFLIGGLVLDLSSGSYVLSKLARFVSMHSLWYPIAGAILSTFLAYALTAYVADVAVYTSMDARSRNFAARNAILGGSTAALKQLLVSGYDRVILCGHSLGSVVAYDTINELLTQYNATAVAHTDPPDSVLTLSQLHTLKALVTFGSPLDKIWYFFREHVKRDQAIRAQVLSMLHSFRRLRTGRTYGEFEFSYHFNQLDGLEWRNAWARMDPISAELKFYRVDRQRRFPYRWPVLAHLSYWSDPHFYDYVCELL